MGRPQAQPMAIGRQKGCGSGGRSKLFPKVWTDWLAVHPDSLRSCSGYASFGHRLTTIIGGAHKERCLMGWIFPD